MFSLVRFEQPLHIAPPFRLVSLRINGLQRRPKLLYISFGFCDHLSLVAENPHFCGSVYKRFFDGLATQVFGALKFWAVGAANALSNAGKPYFQTVDREGRGPGRSPWLQWISSQNYVLLEGR